MGRPARGKPDSPGRAYSLIAQVRFKGVKAVIFDLDDTLTVHQAAYDASYLAMAEVISRRHAVDPVAMASGMPGIIRRAGETGPQSDFVRRIGIGGRDLLWGEAGDERPELADISKRLDDFRVSTWLAVLQAHGISDNRIAARLADQFPDEMWARIRPFRETEAIVRDLAGRFKLGMLTNGMPPHQHRKLAASGVADAFDTVVTSGGLGVGKPDRTVFQAVLGEMGVSASEALMIGDTFERDVEGAVDAGLRAVWVDRGSSGEPQNDMPCRRVSSLNELVELL